MNIRSNTPEDSDTKRVNIIREYKIFDLLPKDLKILITEADSDYNVEEIAKDYLWLKKQKIPSYVIMEIFKQSLGVR